MAAKEVARIVDASGVTVAPIQFSGYSYSVPAISYRDKRGRLRRVFGCKDNREAFLVAKRLARKAGRDVTGWRMTFT